MINPAKDQSLLFKKRLKIRFFYDTNNNFLHLCRLLQQQGIDAKVIPRISIDKDTTYRVYDAIKSEKDLELFEITSLHDLDILENPFTHSRKQVSSVINKIVDAEDCFTLSVASYIGPAVFEYANIELNIFFATGADTVYLPFHRKIQYIQKGFKISLKKMLRRRIAHFVRHRDSLSCKSLVACIGQLKSDYLLIKSLPRRQEIGIRNSTIVLQDSVYLDRWENTKSLRTKKACIPMESLDVIAESKSESADVNFFKELTCKLEKNYDYIILSSSKNGPTKGTNHLLTGYMNFKKKHPLSKSLLILSGRDGLSWISNGIESEFAKLIREKSIILLPLIPQKCLDPFYEISTICFGKINTVNAYLNATISKVLAHGKPIICYIEEDYKRTLTDVYPHISCVDGRDVTDWLTYYYSNRGELEKLGYESSAWFKKFADNSARDWLQIITDEVSIKSSRRGAL